MNDIPMALIAAMDRNGLIGAKGQMPWHLPEDLRWFKENTMGNPILMGRKTYESIGGKLPGRSNLVLSRNKNLKVEEGVAVIPDLPSAITLAEQLITEPEQKIFVIGGAQIFKECLPLSQYLYLTFIDTEFEGDTYFPEYDKSQWELLSQKESHTKEGIKLTFTIWKRLD